MSDKKKVAVIMGSDSDLPVLKNTINTLKSFGIPVETHIMSAHRTPAQACEFSSHARENGFGVIIAAAGKAAHLAGVLAAHTTLPVIGIPMKTSDLGGVDSLYSIVQMPKGVPVATFAIGEAGAANAALYAVQILGTTDVGLADKLAAFRKAQNEKARNMTLPL